MCAIIINEKKNKTHMIFVRHFVKNDNIFNVHVKKGYWLDRLLYGLFNEKKKYHVVYSGACVSLLCIKKIQSSSCKSF